MQDAPLEADGAGMFSVSSVQNQRLAEARPRLVCGWCDDKPVRDEKECLHLACMPLQHHLCTPTPRQACSPAQTLWAGVPPALAPLLPPALQRLRQ